MSIRDLRGKQVVVTGAVSGIGRGTAIAFAREGANIVAADLDVLLSGVLPRSWSTTCAASRSVSSGP